MTEGVKNFTNIDEEDFEGMYGGEPIILRRGQTKAFTETVAKHLAGQLAEKILVRQKKDSYADPGKGELINKMLGDVVAPPPSPIPAAPAETPAPAEEKEEEFPEIKEKVKEPKKKTRTRRIK